MTKLRRWFEFQRTANHAGAPAEEQSEPQSTNLDSELYDYSIGDVESFIRILLSDLSLLAVRSQPCPSHHSQC